MYVPHPQFDTPSDDVILWRYMDIGRFIALLDSKALYFARLHELGDPWEAAWPSGLKRRIREELGEQKEMFDLAQSMASQVVVSCWHANDHESVAMWKLYTSGLEGVAIKTTCGRLKRALWQEPRSVTITSVRYIDYEIDDDGTVPGFNTLGPLFCKRKSFQHEREVRAMIAFPDELEMKKAVETIKPTPGQFISVPYPLGDKGLEVPLDLSGVITSVILSPHFPKWAALPLQRVMERSGLAITAETSDLLRKPSRSHT